MTRRNLATVFAAVLMSAGCSLSSGRNMTVSRLSFTLCNCSPLSTIV